MRVCPSRGRPWWPYICSQLGFTSSFFGLLLQVKVLGLAGFMYPSSGLLPWQEPGRQISRTEGSYPRHLVIAVSLSHSPFSGRRPRMMPASGLLARSTRHQRHRHLAKCCRALFKAPPPCRGGKCDEEGSSPRGEGSRTSEGSFPRWEQGVNEKARESLPKVKDVRHVASVSRGKILCPLPGTCMEDARR
jgi:hypothetical protein